MSLTTESMSAADLAAVCGNNGNRNNDGMFGNDWAWIIILLLFGWGGRGGYGGFGGNGGGYSQPIVIDAGRSGGCCSPCATQADLAAGFNNSAVLSNLNDLQLGQAGIQQTLCQGFNGVNTAILQGFNGVDNAVCNLGYNVQSGFNGLSRQIADCCCDTRGAIKDVGTGVERAGWNLSKQISDCCCDIEKMNMQSRFDAQAYNCNTLQAIDKLGDRIIDHLTQDKIDTLRSENQALKFQASQTAQNAFITANQDAQTAELIRRLGRDIPVPAYVVPNPNCCYQYSVQPTCGCNSGCGSF